MGAERRSMIMSDDEKRTTAYHEAGHALVAAFIDDADPIHKVTIIPRGMAMGVTMLLPESDRLSHDRELRRGPHRRRHGWPARRSSSCSTSSPPARTTISRKRPSSPEKWCASGE